MRVSLEDTIHPRFFTHSTTGAAADADSTPTVNVKEDGGAAFTTGVTVTDDGVGEYYATIVCTAANGFEAGKWYEVAAFATVGGVTSKQSVCRFQLMSQPAAEGTPNVNVSTMSANAITRASLNQDVKDALRELRRSTATAGGASTITLDASASSVNDFYKDAAIFIASGTGNGQFRMITGYVGATKVATVDHAWSTNPDATSVFVLFGVGIATVATGSVSAGAISFAALATDLTTALGIVRRNTAQTGSTSTTIRLDASASSTNDRYNGMTVYIVSGTGAEQERQIIDYNGTTKDATVDHAWITTPDSSTAFVIRSGAPTVAGISRDVWATIGEDTHSYGDLIRLLVGVISGTVADFLDSTQAYKSLNAAKTRVTVTTSDNGRDAIAIGDLTL